MLQLLWFGACTMENHDGKETAWSGRKCFGEEMKEGEAGLGMEMGILSLG